MILSSMVKSALLERDRKLFMRAVVIAVDVEGGLLQNPNGSGEISFTNRDGQKITVKAIVGVSNPRGSIKARILTDGFDRLIDDDNLRVFWPLFPQDQIGTPITPDEHVYVTFEDEDMTHGLWVSRVPGHESAGSFKGSNSYVEPSTQRSAMDSFEPNTPDYKTDDASASLAPSTSAMDFFDV